MNIEIKNIHAIQSLVEHHCEKVISISGKPDNSRAKEILELAHKKNIIVNRNLDFLKIISNNL